jgi:hypothetical protein
LRFGGEVTNFSLHSGQMGINFDMGNSTVKVTREVRIHLLSREWQIISFIMLLVFCTFFISRSSSGQDINPNLRSLDNNQSLAKDTLGLIPIGKIKQISLQKKKNSPLISLGGEFRERFRYTNHINFGDVAPGESDHDLYFLHRFMLHTDLKLSKSFRVFTQFTTTSVSLKNKSTYLDKDQFSVLQNFLDIILFNQSMRFRIGRQEISYGMERMIGTRDGPNNRQTFDGINYSLFVRKIRSDIFLVHPVVFKPGFTDNTYDPGNLLFATYWQIPFMKNNQLDLYYFRNSYRALRFGAYISNEYRHSIGMRISKIKDKFQYDAETTWQTGSYGQKHIHAWQVVANFEYRLLYSHLSPRIAMIMAAYSGDKDTTDNYINLFRPVLSAIPPVSDMLPVGPGNFYMLKPMVEFNIRKDLEFAFQFFKIWRLNKSDGLYSIEMDRMIRPPDSPNIPLGKKIIKGVVLGVDYTPTQYIEVAFRAGIFFPGEYIINTGQGKNVETVSLKITCRF